MNRRGPRNNYDIGPDNVYVLPAAVCTVILVLVALGLLITYACQDSAKTVTTYNEKVEAFNALAKSDREVVQNLFKKFDSDFLDEDFLASPKDMPFTFIGGLQTVLPGFMLIELALLIVLTFGSYWYYKDRKYHLADLPLSTIYGKVLLIVILPIGWPFLLGSRILMWRENRPRKQAENAEVKRLATAELTIEGNIQSVKTNDRVRHVYVEFRTKHYRDTQLQNIAQLQKRIDSQKQDIASHGKRISELQRQLGESKAELQRVEAATPNRETTKREAESEWSQILDMRGVAKVTASKRRAKAHDRFLRVLIKVRVPYQNELYDFGDYEVTFYESHFSCHRVRSGVKLNHDNTLPTYPDGTYDFCFGSRRYDIENYARSGRIIEALTLIIDCFHSVNEGSEQYIPGCYRKVKTVERMKTRLKLQQFLQRRG